MNTTQLVGRLTAEALSTEAHQLAAARNFQNGIVFGDHGDQVTYLRPRRTGVNRSTRRDGSVEPARMDSAQHEYDKALIQHIAGRPFKTTPGVQCSSWLTIALPTGVFARHIRNRRLGDAIDGWAFASLRVSRVK